MAGVIKPVIDKSQWGDGPWHAEPDRVDFVHAGFACMILRHHRLGFLCGYVGVPREHPAYEKPYQYVEVGAHGGLTYADKCSETICHAPAPGMPDDVWWLGFDCGHAGDLAPGLMAESREIHERIARSTAQPVGKGYPFGDETYRDLPYVRRVTERLAEELAESANGAVSSAED